MMQRSLPTVVSLSVRIYQWLLNLGPTEFRREYGEMATRDFRQYCLDAHEQGGVYGVLSRWPALYGEAILELLLEYLFPYAYEGMGHMLHTMRRSMIATFCASVLFFVACGALGKTADPAAPFEAIGHLYPAIGIAYSIKNYCFDIALLAIVLGGLPILFTAVKHALAGGPTNALKLFMLKPKYVLRLLGVSLLTTLGFLGFLLATEFVFGQSSCTPTNGCIVGQPWFVIVGGFMAIVVFVTLFVFAILAITSSLSLAVLRSEFNRGLLRFALIPIGAITLCMSIATFATVFWLIGLWVAAPQFARSSAGLGDGQTIWVVAFIASMAIATLVSAGAFVSGLRASRVSAA
jgi:hypothetical protein